MLYLGRTRLISILLALNYSRHIAQDAIHNQERRDWSQIAGLDTRAAT
jgi:hypothetical protein